MPATNSVIVNFAPLPSGTCTPASGNALMTLLNAQVSADITTTGNTSFYNFGDSEPSAENRIYPWLKTVGGYPVAWFVYVDGAWRYVNRPTVWWCGTSGGAVNTLTATTVNDYYDTSSLHVGDIFALTANLANTGPVTLAINSFGAKNVKLGGNPVTAGYIQQDTHMFLWDGTNFQLLNPYILKIPSYVTGSAAGTATALAGAPVIVATIPLTLPAGKSWAWIQVKFVTILTSATSNGGIKNIDVQVGGISLGLSKDTRGDYLTANNDDNMQITCVLEGIPTGYETSTPLTLDVVATLNGAKGDEVAFRQALATGIAQ